MSISPIFCRDQISRISSVPPAALQQFLASVASRAPVPEPPAAMPLGRPDHVPAGALGNSGGAQSAAIYAHELVRNFGPSRAVHIARAEGRLDAELLIKRAVRS